MFFVEIRLFPISKFVETAEKPQLFGTAAAFSHFIKKESRLQFSKRNLHFLICFLRIWKNYI